MNYQQLFYDKSESEKKLPLYSIIELIKNKKTLVFLDENLIKSSFFFNGKFMENYLMFLNILSNMKDKYENGKQFEIEFCLDLQLSKRRNPPNIQRFEAFFNFSKTDKIDHINIFIPVVKKDKTEIFMDIRKLIL
jgi:hypothetical protein